MWSVQLSQPLLRTFRIRDKQKRAAAAARSFACSNFYFFFGDDFFPYPVSTEAFSAASICLASSACGPLGCSSRYFWNASTVPGGALILPLLSAVARAIPSVPFK